MEILILLAILGLMGVMVAAASLTFVGGAASSDKNSSDPTADSLDASRSGNHWSATGYVKPEGL